MKTWGTLVDEALGAAEELVAGAAPVGVAGLAIRGAFELSRGALRALCNPDTIVEVRSGDGSPVEVADLRRPR